MKLHFFICLIPFILFSCTSKAENIVSKKELRRNKSACTVQSAIAVSKQAQRKAVEEYALSLPAEQKIAQLFLVNIEGNTSYKPVEKASSIDSLSYSSAEKKESASKTPLVPGGCLLFSYNIANTPAKLRSFTLSIRRYCIAHGIVPPYTALDQEGGDVNRLRGITSPLPSEQEVASTMTPDRAYELYHAQGIQMQKLGIDMNLAPVSEAATNLNEQFLGTRSFGSLSSVVSFGTACVNGYENAGVASVLKHFPGNSDTDPHTGLPEIKVTEDELRSVLIAPFVRLSSLEPEALLMSHARVSCLDPQTTGLSFKEVGERYDTGEYEV